MDKPSSNWKSLVIESGSAGAAREESTRLYRDKYTKGSKSGESAYEGGPFRPGSIYTFVYVDDDKPNNRPLLLSMGTFSRAGGMFETGIDLGMIPPQFREFILDRLSQFYKTDLELNEKAVGEGKKARPLRFGWEEAKRALGRSGWQTAATAFDKKKMRQVAIIDYADWGALVGMQTGGVKNLSAAYNTYLKKAQDRLVKDPSWIKL